MPRSPGSLWVTMVPPLPAFNAAAHRSAPAKLRPVPRIATKNDRSAITALQSRGSTAETIFQHQVPTPRLTPENRRFHSDAICRGETVGSAPADLQHRGSPRPPPSSKMIQNRPTVPRRA
mgnify:CR=1 FL=1